MIGQVHHLWQGARWSTERHLNSCRTARAGQDRTVSQPPSPPAAKNFPLLLNVRPLTSESFCSASCCVSAADTHEISLLVLDGSGFPAQAGLRQPPGCESSMQLYLSAKCDMQLHLKVAQAPASVFHRPPYTVPRSQGQLAPHPGQQIAQQGGLPCGQRCSILCCTLPGRG